MVFSPNDVVLIKSRQFRSKIADGEDEEKGIEIRFWEN